MKKYEIGKVTEYINEILSHWSNDFGRHEIYYSEVKDSFYLVLVTGGWSENEEIIESIDKVFWSCFWRKSKCGGYYAFGGEFNAR